MRISRSLICHASSPTAAVRSITVAIESCPTGGLNLKYQLSGNLQQIAIPSPLPPAMADGLWNHTCFEAFIALEDIASYHEFNFSPSGQWAAYAFTDYRSPRQWQITQPLSIKTSLTAGRLVLSTAISKGALPPNPENKPFQMNFTAVIETMNGEHSYWALLHPSASPDFHDRKGFMQRIEATLNAGF